MDWTRARSMSQYCEYEGEFRFEVRPCWKRLSSYSELELSITRPSWIVSERRIERKQRNLSNVIKKKVLSLSCCVCSASVLCWPWWNSSSSSVPLPPRCPVPILFLRVHLKHSKPSIFDTLMVLHFPFPSPETWQASLFVSLMPSMNVPWRHNGKTIQARWGTQTRVNREWVDLCFMGVWAVSYFAVGGLLQ